MPKEDIFLNKVIAQSDAWTIKCNKLFSEQDIKASDRNRVAAALFHLAMEHQGGILHLTKQKHYGSAFALVRPEFEAYIRGVWFHRCATDKQLTNFLDNNDPPKVNELIKGIGKLSDFDGGHLPNLKDKLWQVLCCFTHGGYAQVSWRLSGNDIVSDFGYEQVISLLNIANVLTLQTLVAVSRLAENGAMAEEVKATHKDIFGG